MLGSSKGYKPTGQKKFIIAFFLGHPVELAIHLFSETLAVAQSCPLKIWFEEKTHAASNEKEKEYNNNKKNRQLKQCTSL